MGIMAMQGGSTDFEPAVSPRAKRQASVAVRTSPTRFLAHTQVALPAVSPKVKAVASVGQPRLLGSWPLVALDVRLHRP